MISDPSATDDRSPVAHTAALGPAESQSDGISSAAPRVTVSFVTDRNRLPAGDDAMFGADFPDAASPRMVRGTIEATLTRGVWVPIPSTLRIQASRSALPQNVESLRSLIESGDEVASAVDDFLSERPSAKNATQAERHRIFFVHGYRNSFSDSISSAAQLLHDHQASDILCFSWPTSDELLGYWHDQSNAPRAGQDLALLFGRLLQLLSAAATSSRSPVHVIAHSMGNLALTAAVQAIQHSKAELLERKVLEQVLLCAADVDHMALGDPRELKSLPLLARAVSVYTNAGDSPLAFSAIVNMRARLGAFGPYEFGTMPHNVFWIDCSDLLTAEGDNGSHSYYRTSPGVRADLGQVLAGKPQDQIAPRQRVGQTNKYVLPFNPRTPHARARGYS